MFAGLQWLHVVSTDLPLLAGSKQMRRKWKKRSDWTYFCLCGGCFFVRSTLPGGRHQYLYACEHNRKSNSATPLHGYMYDLFKVRC